MSGDGWRWWYVEKSSKFPRLCSFREVYVTRRPPKAENALDEPALKATRGAESTRRDLVTSLQLALQLGVPSIHILFSEGVAKGVGIVNGQRAEIRWLRLAGSFAGEVGEIGERETGRGDARRESLFGVGYQQLDARS